ncbi:MAG: hypothetical protein VCG02_00005, partial [Verrucomicrobiota bacterium]
MKVVFPIALAILVFCTPRVVLSEEVGKAEITRLKYDEQLAQILVKQEGRINELMGKYANELDRMNAIYRQASNLEGVLAVMGEIERVKSERSISAEQINQTHPELASLQNKVLGYYGVIRKAEAEKIVRLALAFRRSMKSLQTQLTREGKITEAVVTKEMIEDILEGNDYVSAKEYLVAKPAPPVDSAGSPAHAGDGDDPPPDGEAEEEGPRFGQVTIYPKGSEPKRTAKKEP